MHPTAVDEDTRTVAEILSLDLSVVVEGSLSLTEKVEYAGARPVRQAEWEEFRDDEYLSMRRQLSAVEADKIRAALS